MNEHKFLADIETRVDYLVKSLHDSPISLKGHLHYWLGVLDGYCDANGWTSSDRQRVFAKISTSIEILH